MKVDLEKCKGCGFCVEVCPLGVIVAEGRKIRLSEGCVDCKSCAKVCPEGALTLTGPETERVVCTACPIMCAVPEGFHGACLRYFNEAGRITRKERLHTYEELQGLMRPQGDKAIGTPLITGIGSGTTYPDFKPSPFIVTGVREGIDIVTVVTEAPLSYSGVKMKIDTDLYLGEEGRRVYARRKGKRHVGHLCTEEYGSKILSMGGVNILTSRDGLFAAKVLFEFLRGKEIKVEIDEGPVLQLSLGKAPKVNGVSEEHMRVGCGSAVSGLFAPYMEKAADEVIVLDGHITGLFSSTPRGGIWGRPGQPFL